MKRPLGAWHGLGLHVALLCCGLALASPGARTASAATLQVTGPSGAEVLLDGDHLAVLPMDEPVEVEPGTWMLECRKRGYLVHRETVQIDGPESAVSIRLDLQALSRTRAVGSSVVLAGLGQLYQGRTRRGWTMVAMQGTAWLVVMAAEGAFQTARDDYEVLERRYADAVLESEIVRLRGERDAAYDDVESAKDLRTVALGAVLAVGVWSVFDAWKAHGGFFADAEVPAPAGAAGTSLLSGSVAVQWRLGWRRSF